VWDICCAASLKLPYKYKNLSSRFIIWGMLNYWQSSPLLELPGCAVAPANCAHLELLRAEMMNSRVYFDNLCQQKAIYHFPMGFFFFIQILRTMDGSIRYFEICLKVVFFWSYILLKELTTRPPSFLSQFRLRKVCWIELQKIAKPDNVNFSQHCAT
jgi:hypothetical protein